MRFQFDAFRYTGFFLSTDRRHVKYPNLRNCVAYRTPTTGQSQNSSADQDRRQRRYPVNVFPEYPDQGDSSKRQFAGLDRSPCLSMWLAAPACDHRMRNFLSIYCGSRGRATPRRDGGKIWALTQVRGPQSAEVEDA